MTTMTAAYPARWTADNSEGFSADDMATMNEAQAHLEARFPAIDGGNIADLLNNEYRDDLDARQLERAVARRIEAAAAMTASTWARVRRLYERVVGYDPEGEWLPADALDGLRWMRTALTLCNGDPTAYTGPTLTKAQLRATEA